MRPRHDAHAFGGGVEKRMFKKAPGDIRGVARPPVQPDQTADWMT